jgi:predicted amidohydrolase
MKPSRYASLLFLVCAASCAAQVPSAPPASSAAAVAKRTVRACTAQPAPRLINWRLTPAEALSEVDVTLRELEQLVNRAGDTGCDVLALPEDTLGILHWEVGNKVSMPEVLFEAVSRMLERLGKAAASHHMYLVCASDTAAKDGTYRNTAFFLSREGQVIGRYYKVHLPVNESDRVRGTSFPVFKTPDLGWVGLLICYDMVMPEASRALALAGADIIFVPTMGGAAMAGNEDMDRAAFRTRAVDNFVYLAVAKRGSGAMIISPQGKVLAEGQGPNAIAVADIDPFGGREAGDAANFQSDMRARLFRERNQGAYGILTDPNPPVLRKIPATITVEQGVRIWEKMLTTGEERFRKAEALFRAGNTAEAAAIFEELRLQVPGTWIDRAAQERLASIRAGEPGKKEPRQ